MNFLEKSKSKDRLLLTKAYNVNYKNQLEFDEKMDPENRFLKLYATGRK